ncbi:hypothetical protein B4064_3094 [Caldibacillus thermoamylovorans]|nr:hypothetical protein B4064_3094 [Caldibacillus thermoamylovorans]
MKGIRKQQNFTELFLKMGEVLGYVFLLFGMTTIIGRKR